MAHVHEKIDFTASVCIVHDNKVLFHMHKKLHIWLPPGGHVDLDEDPNEAAVREAKEETGLDVELVGEAPLPTLRAGERELLAPRFLNRHFFDATHTHEHIDLCYFARPVSDVASAKPEFEDGELRWLTKEDLEKNDLGIVANARAHALAALEELAT